MNFKGFTAPILLSSLLVACGANPDKVQEDFDTKNTLGIQRYSTIVDGARKGIFTILECQMPGQVPQRHKIGHNAYRPSRYLITKQDEKGGADVGEQVQRIDYYNTTNNRDYNFGSLKSPRWILDDMTMYPRPTDQYIPKDQICKKIDPKTL